jgi:hypothetical protein
MRALIVALCVLWPAIASAQTSRGTSSLNLSNLNPSSLGTSSPGTSSQTQDESKLAAEFRLEMEKLKKDCPAFKNIAGCAVTLVTGHPLHIAIGSIAPQNGFGFGPAFVTNSAKGENWRIKWSADAIGAPTSGAWRVGTYFNAVRTAVDVPQVVTGPSSGRPRPITIHEYPVFNGYAQAISLPKVNYFGMGMNTSRDARTTFGMKQGVVGGSAIVPVLGPVQRWRLSVVGEVNGRFVDIRPGEGDVPSIESRFAEATAPGLSMQPAFTQFGEGLRFKPSLFDGRVNLAYLAQLQQFVAGDSSFSFRRWTVDLAHEFPIYRNGAPVRSRDTNGPNECAVGPTTNSCPPLTRDRWGAASVRVLASKSSVGDGSVVPFYFQQTLGGSDINGNRALASYDDYRFRGPHLFLIQESFEHSLFGVIGAWLQAEQGKVALQDDPLFSGGQWVRSFGLGLTVKAGGFPVVTIAWSTGRTEGHHIAFTIDTSLLGGSARPSLQ